MAIKLDTSSPQQQLLSQGSFDPLPGVTSLDAGASQAYQSLARTAGQVANKLQQTKEANQKLLITDARYKALGSMQEDSRAIEDAIRNNKEGYQDLVVDFNNKYSTINLNDYLSDDEPDRIVDDRLSRGTIGELNYMYQNYSSKLQQVGVNESFARKKIGHVSETRGLLNQYWADNPVITDLNEQEFKTILENRFNPTSENIEPYFSGSPDTEQKRAFNAPMAATLKDNLSAYLGDSPTIEVLDEREQYAKDFINRNGTAYGLDVVDIDTATLRKNIKDQQETFAQARIQEVLDKGANLFLAIEKNPSYSTFHTNVGKLTTLVSGIHPSVIKYATEKQLESVDKVRNYMYLISPEEDGTIPLQEIFHQATVSKDPDFVLNQLQGDQVHTYVEGPTGDVKTVRYTLSEKQLSEINSFASSVASNMQEAEKNNRPDAYRFIYPEIGLHIDQGNWSEAQQAYEEKVYNKEMPDGRFYWQEKKLPKYLADTRPLMDLPKDGYYSDDVIIGKTADLLDANKGNPYLYSALGYYMNGEGGDPLSKAQVMVAKLATSGSEQAVQTLAPFLVPTQGNFRASDAQIDAEMQNIENLAKDDLSWIPFRDTRDPYNAGFYAVENSQNTENNTEFQFHSTLMRNVVASLIDQGVRSEDIAFESAKFYEQNVTPVFGQYSVFENDGRNIEIQLHPSTLEYVDPEMKHYKPAFTFLNEVGKNFNQESFELRSGEDVTETTFVSVMGAAYTMFNVDMVSFYEGMGENELAAYSERNLEKSKTGMRAFINGSIKNTYVPEQYKNIIGFLKDPDYVGRNAVKITTSQLNGVDVYVPMYYDPRVFKWVDIKDLNGDTVAVPVDMVNGGVKDYNVKKNKFQEIQLEDITGPLGKKVRLMTNFFANDLIEGNPVIDTSGGVIGYTPN